MQEFAVRFIHWQAIKEVWQLHAVAHDCIGFLAFERITDIMAIVRVVEALNRLLGA